MSDEDRRRLEREARYDSSVSALLACLREGHLSPAVPAFRHEQLAILILACGRCGLVYWKKDDETAERHRLEIAARVAVRAAQAAERAAREQRERDIGGTFRG